MRICPLRNPVMEYAWGSPSAIPELLGEPNPEGRPRAELWMGAHPRASSRVRVDGDWLALDAWIEGHPREILGEGACQRFGSELPFLLKVLAAEKPLSIQAHPSEAQARAGFDRENARGLPPDAPERCYRDPRAKPEILCALTPFEALLGFRRVDLCLRSLRALGSPELEPAVEALTARPDAKGLRELFSALMGLGAGVLSRVLAAAAAARGEEFAGVRALARDFPDDVGVLAPLLLNRVSLSPGEAIFLPAGELHAYLRGVGVELMANSDNVLRGGLTEKFVDLPELLEVLHFGSREPEVLRAVEARRGEWRYATPAREFELARLEVRARQPFASEARRDVQILLCVEGEVRAASRDGTLALRRGASAVAPAAAGAYTLEGEGVVYRAGIPPLH